MAEKIRVMIPEDKVDARIKEIGEAISKQYEVLLRSSRIWMILSRVKM